MSADADLADPASSEIQEVEQPVIGEEGTVEEIAAEIQPPAETVADSNSGAEKADPEVIPKNESPAQKEKRESRDREASAWKKIEAEKAELNRHKAEIAAEKAKIEEARRETEKRNIYRDANGHSAEEYEKLANEFKAEGEDGRAELALKKANEIRETGARKEQELQQQAFNSNFREVTKERKEYLDPDSADGQRIKGIFSENPHLFSMPDGFARAVRLDDQQRAALSVPELQRQLKELKAEKERLEKLTSIDGSNPSGARTATKAGKQTEADLMRMLELADQEDVPMTR